MVTKGNDLKPKKSDSVATATKKVAVLAALIVARGNVTEACTEAAIARKTYYAYYNTDNDFRAAVDDVPEIVKDYVEGQLMKNIAKLKEASIIFYAKTKMKDRGYVEADLHLHKLQAEFNITVENKEDLEIVHNLVNNIGGE